MTLAIGAPSIQHKITNQKQEMVDSNLIKILLLTNFEKTVE